MSRARAHPIEAVLRTVLRQAAEKHGALLAIQREWKRLVGRRAAAHTLPVSLHRGRLVIRTDRPGEGFALRYEHPGLLERLQELVGSARVEELVVRPGELRARKRVREAEATRTRSSRPFDSRHGLPSTGLGTG